MPMEGHGELTVIPVERTEEVLPAVSIWTYPQPHRLNYINHYRPQLLCNVNRLGFNTEAYPIGSKTSPLNQNTVPNSCSLLNSQRQTRDLLVECYCVAIRHSTNKIRHTEKSLIRTVLWNPSAVQKLIRNQLHKN